GGGCPRRSAQQSPESAHNHRRGVRGGQAAQRVSVALGCLSWYSFPPQPREVAFAGRPSPCSAPSCHFPPAPCLSEGQRAGQGAIPLDPGGGDPDNVVLCLLAADEDDDRDVALQIHFTLIQAFCCENDIDILRVSNPGRLAELLLLETDAGPTASEGAEQPPDLHCVLVTNPHSSQWKDPALSQLICFCRESRYMDQWVPVINLPER
uniref:Growth arrest and DNA damage-inducible protein GADD45 alpha n=3 Tax=Sus scrofa TaxID=9823 RepID=A0A8D1BZL0_PIG